MYPSVPELLIASLTKAFPAARVLTDLPADLEAALPVIGVSRFGGTDATLTLDRASIDIDVWDFPLTAADLLAGQVWVWLRLGLPGATVTGITGAGTFARVDTISGPSERPTGNPNVRRVGASFQVTVHSH